MSVLDELDLILHRIRVKLYPNYFKNVPGAYIARTNNERTLYPKDIATALMTRGGGKWELRQVMEIIEAHNAEIMYQIMDGYAVSNGYTILRLNIGGTFNGVNEAHDPEKHPITLRHSITNRTARLIKKLGIDIEGLADTGGYIDEVIDQEANLVNSQFVPGHMVAIHGHKIMIAGTDPACGLYLVPVDDPSQRVKILRIGDNTPTRITFIALSTGFTENRIEIVTQFSGNSATPLKSPRIITSPFIIQEA